MSRSITAVVLLLALFASAHASTVLRLDWAGLLQRSELVVEGRVVSVTAELDAQGRVRSRLALRVDGSLRGGRAGELLEFSWPGGSFGDLGELVVGLPIPAPGQELLLFLRKEAGGLRLPVGLAQGVLRRHRDPITRELVYTRSLSELSFVDEQGAPLVASDMAERIERESLLRDLERAAAEQAERGAQQDGSAR
ncbi:MAG: hypothetical protein DHS20C15_33880 [Planctomycetota bacterium]|nr:MAG: hypothetical protein DHS20C15_33880 [Planctomycetota bacterium]